MGTVELTERSFEETLGTHSSLIVNFWGGWSKPCQRFAPVFAAAAERHPGVLFATVDTGLEQGLELRFDVKMLPTVIGFHQGVVSFSREGPMSEAALERAAARLALRRSDAVPQ